VADVCNFWLVHLQVRERVRDLAPGKRIILKHIS